METISQARDWQGMEDGSVRCSLRAHSQWSWLEDRDESAGPMEIAEGTVLAVRKKRSKFRRHKTFDW